MKLGRIAPSNSGHPHIGLLFVAYFYTKYLGIDRINLRFDDTNSSIGRININDIVEVFKAYGVRFNRVYSQNSMCSQYAQCLNSMKLHSEEGGALSLQLAGRVGYWDGQLKRKVLGDLPINLEKTIVRKSNGEYGYHFSSACDDAISGITHIARGRDHSVNTFIHCLMWNQIGYPIPNIYHLPLLTHNKEKISKSNLLGRRFQIRRMIQIGIFPQTFEIFFSNYYQSLRETIDVNFSLICKTNMRLMNRCVGWWWRQWGRDKRQKVYLVMRIWARFYPRFKLPIYLWKHSLIWLKYRENIWRRWGRSWYPSVKEIYFLSKIR